MHPHPPRCAASPRTSPLRFLSSPRNRRRHALVIAVAVALTLLLGTLGDLCLGGDATPPEAVALPDGVRAVWDFTKAHHEATPTRERVCLNSLWLWQPTAPASTEVPRAKWGYFKVPGAWPGITDYMEKDCQTVFAHPAWKDERLRDVTAAWYEREIEIPASWAGRHIGLSMECLNSLASVYIDGSKAGEIRFPGGSLDLTPALHDTRSHRLAIHVMALPLKYVLLSYTDSASARETKGSVARRGLCGDVYLTSVPAGPTLELPRVETSVRKWELSTKAAVSGLQPKTPYSLHAQILDGNRPVGEFDSPLFQDTDASGGKIDFKQSWRPEKLWDVNTLGNVYTLRLSLRDQAGRTLDTAWDERFGFREFWIDGRDFYLNGKRMPLCAVPLDNAQIGAAWATYAAAKESLERLQSFGINFVYTHNYDCLPGAHLAFPDILRAADDTGMLVSFAQPHFSHYEWPSPDADRTNGYALHAKAYVETAGNHPSVVFYSMSHNATGYNDDMNPDLIDGVHAPRDTWALKNTALALRAEAIVRSLDPGRIVYHHASGNLGSLHAINFYPNFVPIQELSDWFEHWSKEGVKPVFLCEYGAPFSWDWTLYRGWYKGQREFGSAAVPWQLSIAEWNAQFLGDRAYAISEPEKADLRWEAKQLAADKVWHRWDYPAEVGSTRFDERYPIFARYLTDNWRAFRTWGVSATSPWEYGHFWKLREGVDRKRRELPTDWDALQHPGFSPDYIAERYERMDLAFERTDWVATPAAEALYRNNRPLLGYLAGKPSQFTSKDHLFVPGEEVAKQIVLINGSRERVQCDCTWSVSLPRPVRGSTKATLEPGCQKEIPLEFALLKTVPPGSYDVSLECRFSTSETQTDRFTLDVVPRAKPQPVSPRMAVYDPAGETTRLLSQLAIKAQPVDLATDLSNYDVLLIGKQALSTNSNAPDISRVRDGLKVIVFEQTSDVLEKRLGFRVAEYGLREVFPRIPDHKVLDGIAPQHLRDWRGASTLLPPRSESTMEPRRGPQITWCGIQLPRLWRCGNRGNVASVLIEKPACGDFLPILDGGFALQYSPLMEYHEGQGAVWFCQLDVTGRTEPEPVAERAVRNLIAHVSEWKPTPKRSAVYVGNSEGKSHLERAGFTLADWKTAPIPQDADAILVAGTESGPSLKEQKHALVAWFKSGGRMLALGLAEADLENGALFETRFKKGEHIAAFFDAPPANSPFAGIGPSDVHNRVPYEIPLMTGNSADTGGQPLADGVVGLGADRHSVFCQMVPWQFADSQQANHKRTQRRAAFLVTRLLGNLGVESKTPLLARFHTPLGADQGDKRWLAGFYLDTPEEWDYPYRFFRW